jgi:hypothetical protein
MSTPLPRCALTRAQQNVWLADHLAPEPGRFTIGEVLAIDGGVDAVRFEQALRHVLAATEVSLVRFVDDEGAGAGGPVVDVSGVAQPRPAPPGRGVPRQPAPRRFVVVGPGSTAGAP